MTNNWFARALFSAVFAALTAIFAKIGLAEWIRILQRFYAPWSSSAFGTIVGAAGKWSNPLSLSSKTWLFLVLSGLRTGASWVCYFRALKIGDASKVAPVDKLSVLLVALFAVAFSRRTPIRARMGRDIRGGPVVFVLAFKR